MLKPATPEDEKSRLKNLRSLNILDTSAEERFDRLTRLAKRMFNVPIALVSLVDENRQWFKSCAGLDVKETPRDISFCGHAILGDNILIIPDTKEDIRFADNPLVVGEPKIRFYAGCPLQYLDGSKLGTLCIIDSKPRTLNEEDINAFLDLAELAEHELMAVQLATLDELTRISNRRGFITLAQKSLQLCERQKIPTSLVFLDINDFKLINDEFGHAEGDIALINFAEQMRKCFRDSDVLGRLGGDEFVVLLTDTSTEEAEDTISRFRQSIQSYFKKPESEQFLSFSEGIVNIDYSLNHSIETLLKKADVLMYENKKTASIIK